jgi:hypothetical protein
MLAAGFSCFKQIEENAQGAVDAVTSDGRRTNQTKQPGNLLSAVRDGLLKQS